MADLTHIAFRDATNGRYLFHAKYPTKDVRQWQLAATLLGVTMDEFVHRAVTASWERHLAEQSSSSRRP